MKISDWTYQASWEAMLLIAFWLSAGLVVVGIMALLYWFLHQMWEWIDWKLLVWRTERVERKEREAAEIRRQEAESERRNARRH